MKTFDHIAIIYNPNSTGDAPQMAKELAHQVARNHKTIGVKATLTPTKRAKHAIELSHNIAKKHTRPLIVSVSGDGGYNEIVNGAMQAKLEKKSCNPVVAVIGAGNANDHRRVMRDKPLIDLIKKGKPMSFDLLLIEAKAKSFHLSRYAHSYIGFGVTPDVGNELNKRTKSLWSEISIILYTYRKYAPFVIRRNNSEILLDNLVFANINEMAKFVKLDEENTVRDGKFEVIELKHRSKLHILGTLLRAALVGFKNPPSFQTYSLKTVDALPIQLDGEIEKLPKNSDITVKSIHRAIESLF
ncbi:MAG: diacylglycerol kinase family protein [Candidatus Saccharimonadales bacterium]